MKIARFPTFIAVAIAVSSSSVDAVTYDWNSATSGSWATSGAWTPSGPATGADNTADFNTLDPTSDLTVTLDGARTIGNLTFGDTDTSTAAGWNIDTGSSGPLTLSVTSGSPTITVNALGTGKVATINAVVSGSNGLTKAGTGTLTLANSSTNYTGATIINDGTLKLVNMIGLATPITVNASGTLELNSTNGAVDNWYAVAQPISGSGTINKTGTGWIDVTSTTWMTNFSGTLNIQEGTLGPGGGTGRIGGDTSTIAVNVSSGALFDIRATGLGAVVKIDRLTGTGTVGTTYNNGASLTVGTGGGSSQFDGTIVGDGTSAINLSSNPNATALTLTKVGAGTLTLTGSNTYTGATTINGGVLSVATLANGGTPSNIGGSSSAVGSLVLGGGTLRYTGSDISINRGFTLTAATTSGIDVVAGTTLTFTGGTSTTAGNLSKIGDGTLALSGASVTYTGSTNVSTGKLQLVNATGFRSAVAISSGATLEANATAGWIPGNNWSMSGTGTFIKTGAGEMDLTWAGSQFVAINLGSGALIDVQQGSLRHGNGFDDTIWENNLASLNVASGAKFDVWDYGATSGKFVRVNALTGTGNVDKGWTGTATMVVGVDSGTGSFSGTLQNTAAGSTLNLIKSGTGTQTLSGANIKHTGATTVSDGQLILADTTAYRSNTSIASGKTLEVATSAPWTIAGAGFDITGTGTLVKSGNAKWEVGASGIQVGFKMGAGGLVDIQQGTIQNNFVRNNWTTNLASVNVASGATFDIFSENVQMDALTGAGTVQNGYAPNGVKTITLGAANTPGTFSGTLTNTGGNIAVTKTGSATQTFSGANIKYSGATAISSGTLALQDTTAFASAIAVGGSGTLNVARTALGYANRSPIMGSAVTGSGIINVNNSGTGIAGGWTTVGVASGLNFSGTINVNSGVLTRDNTSANNITGTATVNVAADGILSPRGGGIIIGALNGAGKVSPLWAAGNATTLTVGNGNGSGIFSGIIHGNNSNPTDGTLEGGLLSLVKIGSGTQTLQGANTYTGTTTISAGALELDWATNLSDSYVIRGAVSGPGTLVKSGAGWVNTFGAIFTNFAGNITINNGVLGNGFANATWTNAVANVTINVNGNFDLRGANAGPTIFSTLSGTGDVVNTLVTAGTLQVGKNDASSTFDGRIFGAGGGANIPGSNTAYNDSFANGGTIALAKIGTGTFTLTGASTFSGGTSITAGTLLVNNTTGSGLGSGNVAVNGGTLGGTGAFTGGVIVNSGTLAPGANIESLDMGALSMLGTSTFALEINTSSLVTDLANVTGNFSLDAGNNVLLSISDLGSNVALTPGSTFLFVDYSGTWNGGLFNLGGSNPLSDDELFTFGANQYRISYNGVNDLTTDVVLQVVAVPEPGSLAMLLFGSMMLWFFRRHRS